MKKRPQRERRGKGPGAKTQRGFFLIWGYLGNSVHSYTRLKKWFLFFTSRGKGKFSFLCVRGGKGKGKEKGKEKYSFFLFFFFFGLFHINSFLSPKVLS